MKSACTANGGQRLVSAIMRRTHGTTSRRVYTAPTQSLRGTPMIFRWVICCIALSLSWVSWGSWAEDEPATSTGGTAYRLTVADAIGPATAEYIRDGLRAAAAAGAKLVVLEIDTPGGLDTAMRDIIQDIVASPVPVATYVSPSGARAASAGTYILYASHIAAMAPGTNLGAATPVQMGGENPLLPEDLTRGRERAKNNEDSDAKAAGDEDGKATQSTATDQADNRDAADDGKPAAKKPAPDAAAGSDAMRHKVINDASAYIRGLAELRGRNADWAELAVRTAASLAAREALEKNVIDIVATDVADLIAQADGRQVEAAGEPVTLNTAGLTVVDFEPDWRHRFLAVITNPSVTYVLIMIGMYGLFFEFSNPGAIIPGVAGAICLLLAAYGLQLLPVNYAGLGLIILGAALMIGEAFAPSFGALGIGGVIAFVVGSIILIDTDVPGFGIPLTLILSFAALSALTLIFFVGALLTMRRRTAVTGGDALIGASGQALKDFTGRGQVRVMGEIWSARSDAPVTAGQRIEVTDRDGLTLTVRPAGTTQATD